MSHWPFMLHVVISIAIDSVLQAAYNTITSTDAGVHVSSTVQESQAHSSDKDADIKQTTTTGIYIFVII